MQLVDKNGASSVLPGAKFCTDRLGSGRRGPVQGGESPVRNGVNPVQPGLNFRTNWRRYKNRVFSPHISSPHGRTSVQKGTFHREVLYRSEQLIRNFRTKWSKCVNQKRHLRNRVITGFSDTASWNFRTDWSSFG